MTLGAVQDLDAIYRMGREIGKEAKRVGIHLNLAPVADVNNNPRNPIIHMRSFGEDARNVADRVSAYIRGMQDEGILACAKHFPGHGDTVVDSHFDLPRIPFDQERLERVELTPFRRAIGDGVAAVMSAHLLVSALDPDRPASLSRRCLEEMLREEMEFGGLIISDALNMQALARYYSPEETAILARGAGCDLLLYGDHIDPNVDKIIHEAIPRAWNALKDAYLRKELSMDELDAAVLRLLRAKEKIGLHRCRAIPTGPVVTEEALALKRELFQKAVTRLGETILLKENCAYLSVGPGDVLAEEFGSVFSADAAMSREEREAIAQTLAPFEQVVIGVHQGSGFSDEALELIRSLSDKAILCHFATPYALRYFEGQGAILIGYENDPEAQRALFDVLTRQRDAPGHLPVRSSVDEKDQHRGRKEFESTQRGKS
jgi:beta-glucosidase-like glycosyl hydrolase